MTLCGIPCSMNTTQLQVPIIGHFRVVCCVMLHMRWSYAGLWLRMIHSGDGMVGPRYPLSGDLHAAAG